MNQTPREVLDTILGHLGFVAEIEEQLRDGHLILQVRTSESDRLIGRRDETLEGLQYLVNRILFSQNRDAPRVIVDVEHHRAMRDDDFLHRIQQLAGAVRENGRPVETDSLNAYDRRLVHNAFREDEELETISQETDAKIKRITIRRKQ
jgi:spoIIIJ-associated protein